MTYPRGLQAQPTHKNDLCAMLCLEVVGSFFF